MALIARDEHSQNRLISIAISFAGAVTALGVLGVAIFLWPTTYTGELRPGNVAGTALSAALMFAGISIFVAIFMMRLQLLNEPRRRDGERRNRWGRKRTTQYLAFGIMGAFVLGLTGTYIAVLTAPASALSETAKTWTEMFRNGFVLLGTTLTTIVGYYFGSRQSEESGRQTERLQDQLAELAEQGSKRSKKAADD